MQMRNVGSMLWMAGVLILVATAPVAAAPRLQLYQRSFVVHHKMGTGTKFIARITCEPEMTIKNGVVTVSAPLKRKVIENSPPGRIRRVTWELEITDCVHPSTTKNIELLLTNRRATVDKNGQLRIRKGEDLREIIVHYKWLKNEKTLKFKQGRVINGRIGNALPPELTFAEELIISPTLAAKDRANEVKKKFKEIKELYAQSKTLRDKVKQLTEKARQKNQRAASLIAAARTERDPRKKRDMRDQASKYLRDGEKLLAEAKKVNADIQKLDKQIAQLGRELRAEIHDMKQISGSRSKSATKAKPTRR